MNLEPKRFSGNSHQRRVKRRRYMHNYRVILGGFDKAMPDLVDGAFTSLPLVRRLMQRKEEP